MADYTHRPRDPRHGHGYAEEAHTLAQQRRYRQLCAALAKAQPFDEESRRDVTERVCGKGRRSTAPLSKGQMAALIREMVRLCRQANVVSSVPSVPSVPRPRWSQDDYITHLEGELGWTGQPERLEGFCARVFGRGAAGTRARTGPRPYGTREKSRLIAALRGLLADQRRGAAFRERPTADQTTKDTKGTNGTNGTKDGGDVEMTNGAGERPSPFHFVPGGLSLLTR